jgi:hypothetical protein
LFLNESFDSEAKVAKTLNDSFEITLSGEYPAHPTSEFDIFIPSFTDVFIYFEVSELKGKYNIDGITFRKEGYGSTADSGYIEFIKNKLVVNLTKCKDKILVFP